MLKKVSAIVLCTVALAACDVSKQQSNLQKEEASQPVTTQTSNNKSLCDQINLEQWSGFDEAQQEPKCQVIKNYNLSSYHCDVSTQAFGFEQDAALVESGEQRIFAYANDEVCQKALDIRHSNAP